MAKIIAALFEHRTEAHSAVEDLVAHGFARDDIGVIAHDDTHGASHVTPDDGPSGLAQGAGIGAAVGGIGGLVLGLAALTVPGIGPVLAAGPLAMALLGTGVGAATGGLIGALVDMGIPEEHAHYYGEGLRRGSTLVTVATTHERAEEAITVLSRHRPIDLSRRAEEWRQDGWNHREPQAVPSHAAATRVPPAATTPAQRDTATPGATTTLPVGAEDVQVGKRAEERQVHAMESGHADVVRG